jgi:hypothetical protein
MRISIIGRREYLATVQSMQSFTRSRGTATEDELWLVEHEPIFTLGLAGKPEHVLDSGSIPIVRTDRGGQVTYHGPGQVVAYPIVDLRPLRIYVKEYVYRLEQAVLDVLAAFGVTGHRILGAPGIYVVSPIRPETRTGRQSGATVFRPWQDCGAGHQGQQSLLLSRRCHQCGHGSEAVHADQPLRLPRPDDDRSGYTGRFNDVGGGRTSHRRASGGVPLTLMATLALL